VGQKLECKVIELDRNRNNVVLSRRAFLEETQAESRKELLDSLKKGEIRQGKVSSIVKFGAFEDLGGIDGLVHVSELSWKHVEDPAEVVEVGQEVDVEILEVDLERERISLSLKSTQEDPWEAFARRNAPGDVIDGKVTKLVSFGSFVEVGEGLEGLVHISELAHRHVEAPAEVVAVGDPVKVKILDIEPKRRRISLSVKQTIEGPPSSEYETSTPLSQEEFLQPGTEAASAAEQQEAEAEISPEPEITPEPEAAAELEEGEIEGSDEESKAPSDTLEAVVEEMKRGS
jgi:small subunit ribosomal protein S1